MAWAEAAGSKNSTHRPLPRLSEQAIGEEVEAEDEAHQRKRRDHGGVRVDREEPAAIVDGAAPVGGFRANAKAEEAERAQKDGGVADAQAEIDDQGPARIGQDFPEHDIPRAFAPGLACGDVIAGFEIHHDAAHDAEHGGGVHEDHRDEDVQKVRVHRPDAGGIGVEGKAGLGPEP